MDLHLMERQLKALSDANRLILLSCLKLGEVCVCDFVEVLRITQPAVSQHLKKLEEAGIITSRKLGTWKHYRLVDNQTPIVQAVLEELEERVTGNCSADTI
ncbi:ArsR/SmtB family transcription factor [Ureibacillus sinduriensis]|uniref:Transcriptional regulator n=1 Tax=Ureibacillus sinduriensis BLB-1 = JCM 15800 TaxID=1384057 RepID=A0A0A3IIY8_9BACL|nr:metalloregulator ArsR/SmtB family transcription factor [Ureibacillus sinduriensis]KGR74797.1 transcriptional regulator [Ureibacillus sinduriensis BLB-1 = JCM 15800]